jgi:DNA-directed RNA polymerase subunit D
MNTIRRLIMNSVPVLAVEEVEFRENSSILYDEVVAHRMGMTPLKTDLESYELADGEPDENNQVKGTLVKEADPENEEPVTVYADDMEFEDDAVEPVNPKTPLIRLQPGQAIECEFTALMGVGSEHGKWSPCLAWFKYYPHITISEQPDNPADIAEQYNPVFTLEDGKLSVDEDAALRHDVIDEGINDQTDGAVTYEEHDDFVMFIESWGQVGIDDLIEHAIQVHNDQLAMFQDMANDL